MMRIATKRFWRRGRTMVRRVAFFVWATLWPALAWAQPAAQEEPEPKRFVNQYVFVVLMIALGIIAVTKPSGREEKIKERYLDED